MLTRWLQPLAECRSERPTGAILPFIMVRRTGGPRDGLTDKGKYSIHVFHQSEALATDLGDDIDLRITSLAPRFGGQQKAQMPDGSDVWVDKAEAFEFFKPLEYLDDSLPKTIYRVSGIYEVHLRYVAAD